MTDPIADMLTRIRNASMVGKIEVPFAYSNIKFAIAEILKKAGFVESVEKRKANVGAFYDIVINLKYDGPRKSRISSIKRISTPGRRMYISYRDIPKETNRQGITIISTPKGIMTNKEAFAQKLGGEVICEVY